MKKSDSLRHCDPSPSLRGVLDEAIQYPDSGSPREYARDDGILKKLLSILLSLSFILFTSKPAMALSQFSTDYQVTYDVTANGVTDVTFDITQKNNLSTVYATSFSLSLNQTKIDSVKVTQNNNNIIPEVKSTQNLTNISFDFTDRIVGKDKENKFKITFKTSDVALNNGSIWEVNIPKLETDDNTNNQTITLKVPPSFGVPSYIDPKPLNSNDSNIFTFSPASLGNRSISAIFGDNQYYRLNLRYQLNNPLTQNLATQIALPPDTAYQQIMIEKLDPKPIDIQVDPDGNWLASYKLPPSGNLLVSLSAVVKLSLNPKKISANDLEKYLRPTDLWNYDDPKISDKLPTLKTPQSIYDFVVDSLNYNFDRLSQTSNSTRGGATFALAYPNQTICTDFSDLFIALARKNQIPSREVQGFALSSNDKLRPISLTKDVLHSWVEYYDPSKEIWVQIDPTWGNTTKGIDYFKKLDLNHIVFAIHGQSPTQPLPAGAYKTSLSLGKDVSVIVVPKLNFPDPIVEINSAGEKNQRIVLEISNQGMVSLKTDAEIASTQYTYDKKIPLYIVPFSSTSLEIDIRTRPLFRSVTQNLIISLNGQPRNVSITIRPYIHWATYFYLFTGGSVVFAVITWYLHLRRRKKNSPLHW